MYVYDLCVRNSRNAELEFYDRLVEKPRRKIGRKSRNL